MAVMSVAEWRKKKEQEKAQGTSSSSATPTTTSKQTTSSDDSTGVMSPSEWKAKKATKSVDGWAQSATSLLKETQDYFSTWRTKDAAYDSLYNRRYDLLAQADNWRKQYAGNDEAVAYINSIVSALSDAGKAASDYFDFYSQFENEDQYNFWQDHSTAEARQNWYTSQTDRLNQLKADRDAENSRWKEVDPIMLGAESMEYQTAVSEHTRKLKDIDKEISAIEAEIRNYERGNYNEAGQYYGSKTVDDYHSIRKNYDFDSASANRDFSNPTRDDLTKYDALSDSSTWYFDADGTYRDVFGNELVVDESGNWVNPYADGYQVADRLGMYLSASESDVQEAVGNTAGTEGAWATVIKDGVDGSWGQLTEEEIDIYYYLLNRNGQSAADKYLSDMKTELNRRETASYNQQLSQSFDKANALERLALSISTTPAQLFSSATGAIEDIANVVSGNDINPYSAAHRGMNYSNTIRSEQAMAFDEATGYAAIPFINFTVGDLYQAGMSAFDMYIGGKLGAGTYEALMGMGAASSEAMRLYEQGATAEQIAFGGLLAGGAEMVFEHASIENLIKMKDAETVLQFVKNALIQGGIEASEEGFTEIANTITNAIVMGDQSDWAKLLAENNGNYLHALVAKTRDIGNAAMSGFVSGGFGGSAHSAVSAVANETQARRAGKAIMGAEGGVDSLITLGKKVGEASTGDAKNDLMKQIGKVEGKANARRVGMLYNTVQKANDQANAAANQADIAKSLERKGYSAKNANAIAEALVAQYNGQELTEAQSKVLKSVEHNTHVLEAVSNIMDNAKSTMGQRSQNIRDFQKGIVTNTASAKTAQKGKAEPVKAPAATVVENASVQASDKRPAISEDGVTRQVSTGKEVTPQKIASIDGGKVMIQTNNGTVAADDIEFDTKDTDLLWRSAVDFQGINTEGANGIIHTYRSDMLVATYLHGASQEFRNGYYNMESGGEHADKLAPWQRNIIYGLGQKAAGESIAKKVAVSKKEKTTEESSSVGDKMSATVSKSESVGKVHFDRKGRTFDGKRETALKTMEQLSKALGVEFYVYESYVNEAGQRVYRDADGNEVKAPNGFYDPKDGSIHIDLNAGADGKGTMLFTIAHELTHFIRQWSPAKFKVLANFLIEQYGEKGVSVDKLVRLQIAKAKKNGRTIDYDTAFEEMVADSMEAIMTDGNVVQMMADLKQYDKSLWQKICDWFKDLAADLKAIVDAYNGVKPDSNEGKMVAQMQDVIKTLESLYAEALVDASENYQMAEKNTTQEGGAKFSVRETVDGRFVAVVESDILEDIDTSNWNQEKKRKAQAAASEALKQFSDGIVVNGVTRAVNRTSRREYTRSKDTARLYRDNTEVFADKMRAADVADDIVIAATDWNRDGGLTHPRTDDFVDFDHGQTLIMSGTAKYSAEVVVGITSNGAAVFYDVVDMTPTEFEIKNTEPHSTATTNESIGDIIGGSADSNVAQPDAEVKEKFSDRDSDGNTLSQAQQEYFKDSKVRDEQGRLLAMYHGTPNGGFTKFRSGTYFTQNPGYADVYQNPGASSISAKRSADAPMTYKVYLDIQKPFDTRNARERRIFRQEFYRKYGTGTPLADSGLPDWVDGMDLQEFIEEMEYDYDGLILDEGGVGGYGDEVKSRGISYVVFSSEQVKDVGNKTPTSDPDYRYSDRYSDIDPTATYAEIQEEQQKLYQRENELRERKREAENNPELLQAMDDYSNMFSEMRGLLSKKRTGTASQMELDRIDEIKTQREDLLQRVADIQENLGLNAMTKEAEDIRTRKEALRIASDEAWAREGAERENQAIEKAGLPAPEYFRKKALKAFKTTTNFNEAGYLLPDGKLLNFSGGERNHRYRDHREIGEIYEATQGAAALNRFLNDGNIRIMAESPGIDLATGVEPTKEQYAAIKRFVTSHGTKERKFFVDFSDAEGRRAGNYAYDGYVNADRVVNDIKYYFENGTVREQSSIANFLQSERDADLEKVNRVLEKENAELKYDISYLKELLKLQNQVTDGTKFTRTSVEASAGQLMKYANAKGDKTELAKLLNGLYEYIAKGDGLTWDGVVEAAQPAVEWLQSHVKANEKLDSYAQAVLREIRGSRIYLDELQKKEVAYRYGSVNEFRKIAMGSVILTDKDAVSLDTQWHEWASMYPNLFDPNISSNDMPAALMEVFDNLRSMTEVDAYSYDQELIAHDLLRQVYDSYWNVSTLYTVADKAQKEIDKLKFDHSKRMTNLRQFHRENTEKLKAEHREALQHVKQAERERFDKKLQETRDRYQQSKEKNVENRRKSEMRRKIRRTIMDLDKILNNGDKKRNVKEDMKDLVTEALRSADILFTDNYSNEDMIRNGVGTELTEQESRYLSEARDLMEQIGKLPSGSYDAFLARQEEEAKLQSKLGYRMHKLQDVFARERARLAKAKVSEVLGNLADAYKSLESSEYNYVNGAFHENVYQYLLMVKSDVGGTIVKDMSMNQLEELHKAYTMVLTTVRNANKMFAANLKETREQLGSQTIMEVQMAGGEHGLWAPGEDKISTFFWNNLKPVYAFERIGSGTLKKLFENTRAGEDSWAQDMTEARAFYLEQTEKYKYDSWDFEKQYKFTSTSGIDFSLNLEQIMSLYAYSKRAQAHDHLMKGGFVFDGNTEVQVSKMGIKMTYLNKTAKAHNVSPEILGDIVSKLNAEQKAFVDTMQDYLSTNMGGKGNEVSMQMYGVKLFNEKHYFPLRSAGQYMERAKEADLQKQQGQISIVNSGFAKATTPKSSNPVVLSGFMDVWADHVNEMSMYHSFVLPMEDFRRVYNYSSPNMETGRSISVNSVIQDAYGEAATGYIDQLYRDLNGGAVSDPRENPVKALMGKFKKAAVFASLSVVVQQPSAIGRAFAIIDPKYFIGGKVDQKRHKALWAELKRYAPVATIKEMGYFDTGMGKSAQDFIKGKEYHGLKEKAAALFTDGDYRDEVLSKAPALADELTWCAIWDAAKRETKAKHPKMDVRSEEFLQKAGERFTEVITKTQVYDSVLSRSANMRSKGVFMSMWTAFMAEPTTTINMVEDAIRKGKRGDKKYAARAMGAVMTSIVINSILSSLVYAMRDDDEDETFLEKYVQSFATEILDGINPLTYYPLLKDIWSVLQGYDIERSDMSLISSLVEKITKLAQAYGKETDGMDEEELEARSKSIANAWWGVVDYATAMVGIPVKNVRRDINGAVNMVRTISQDLTDRDTSWGSLIDQTWDEVKNTIPVIGWMPDATAVDKLYKATVNGDTAYQKRLESAYNSRNSLDNAIRKGLRANDSRIWEAAMAWNNNDLEAYKRIAKAIVSEGHFSQDNVVMAIQAEAKAMLPKESESGTESKAKGYFTAEKFAVAVSQGNSTIAATIKADIIETAQRNGKTLEEAENSFASSAKSYMKDLFQDNGITQKQIINALTDYCGYEQEDAEKLVGEWAFNGQYGFNYDDRADAYKSGAISASALKSILMDVGGKTSEEADLQIQVYDWQKEGIDIKSGQTGVVKDYNDYCKPAGIDKKTYFDAYLFYQSSGEEGVAYSKTKECVAYINRLPLTSRQKTALALCWWAEATVNKYKTW